MPLPDEGVPRSGNDDPRIPFESTRSTTSPHVVEIPESITSTSSVVIVRFEVQDTGSGLTEAQRGQLF